MNPSADVSVKLVSEVGVGTVAAGVAKARADHFTISGYDGGTGAAPLTSLKHAGGPWETGLAETQQTLVLNGLRGRVALQADGGIRTGRDVVIAALLGADQMGFSTAPLIAAGCIMMRKCHLNTCPVGVATQDPVLRKRFKGTPEHVVNYFFFVAEEVREILASLGFTKLEEAVGRSDVLDKVEAIAHWKARGLDFTKLFHRPKVAEGIAIRHVERQHHPIDTVLDRRLIEKAKHAIETGEPVVVTDTIRNSDRAAARCCPAWSPRPRPRGAARRHHRGEAVGHGRPELRRLGRGRRHHRADRPRQRLCRQGSVGGQADHPAERRAEIARGPDHHGRQHRALWGDRRRVLHRGAAGERFAVRNSGAITVVEGMGDHGCEYMTGGVVVSIGETGRNFAAGMSGGIAYVLDEDGSFSARCNLSMVDLEPVEEEDDLMRRFHQDGDLETKGRVDILADMSGHDEERLSQLITNHLKYTGSPRAKQILDDWASFRTKFVKVMPVEYRRALREMEMARMPWRRSRALGIGARANGRRSRNEGLIGCSIVDLRASRVDRWARSRVSSSSTGRSRSISSRPTAFALPRVHAAAGRARPDQTGGALHGLRHPVLPRPDRLPGPQPDPGLERPRIPVGLGGGVAQPPLHQQLPRIHRPRLPRALRGGVHAQPREPAGRHQDDRAGDRRPRLEHGLDQARAGRGAHRQACGHRRFRPAGLAAAQQLARVGHDVHVFEREPKAGGLLRYGIPDFKMEKRHIDRRVRQMEAEGVVFHYNQNIGVTKPVDELKAEFDAVMFCGGAEDPRNPQLPGQELEGVHYAMPYLVQSNRRVAAEPMRGNGEAPILASGKNVVVIGGGDTASDCVGTAFRQGALSVTQLDIRPRPPEREDKLTVWPYWPTKMRTSSSQAEGAEREFQAATLRLDGNKKGRLTGVVCARVDAKRQPIPGTEFILGRPRVHGHRLRRLGAEGAPRAIRHQREQARQCRGERGGLPHLGREDLERRRYAPGPVAGGLGDPRGSSGGPRHRRDPDGCERPAALGGAAVRRRGSRDPRRFCFVSRAASGNRRRGRLGRGRSTPHERPLDGAEIVAVARPAGEQRPAGGDFGPAERHDRAGHGLDTGRAGTPGGSGRLGSIAVIWRSIVAVSVG